MEIKILEEKVNIEDLREFSEVWYLDFLKGCVDLGSRRVAIGGDYHMESCELLSSAGGKHADIWGFNIRFLDDKQYKIEFDSLVNIKPRVNNGRVIENEELQKEVEKLIREFINI
jgi:Protein of unknown function (DUF5674)